MLYTILETTKIYPFDPRDYLRRVVMGDIDTPYTDILPRPIEEVLEMVEE